MINRTVDVPAYWSAVGKYKKVKVATGKKTKGLFGREKEVTREEQQFVQTGLSDCDIDAERLAADVASAVAELNDAGYEVVAITPVISGAYDAELKWGWSGNGGAGYGYGYSFTKGMIILARHASSG